jgi:signal transduction histidine kinase
MVGPFKNYTLHNRDHIKKILHLAEYVIGPESLQLISPAECLVLIYAAYMHDMGMALPEAERKGVLSSEPFRDSIEQWEEIKQAIDQARRKIATAGEIEIHQLTSELADLQNAALANYLRPIHATAARYRSFIQLLKKASNRGDLFQIQGQSFERELIAICESHNLPATVLGEIVSPDEDRFPRRQPIGSFYVTTQYIATILRLADILDFDYERTPRSLFESLGIKHSTLPGAEVTLLEWQKHLAVRSIDVTKNEIVISGSSTHPIIEAGIKEFCATIQKEIYDTIAVLRRNPQEVNDTYQVMLPPSVRANIRSDGYTFMDLALKLDEAAVMSLLMGNQLYDSPFAAVRELIQNGVDACVVRRALVMDPTYQPKVSVSVSHDDRGAWVVVTDNGIGMDEYVLKQHFFHVGSSYYRSHEFKQLTRNTGPHRIPIGSKFGIGFLSTFMLGHEIGLETRKLYPGGGLSSGYRIHIERMGALAFVQEDESLAPGTTVRLRLKTEDTRVTLDAIRKYIQTNVVRPACDVEIALDSNSYIVGPENFYSVKISDKSELHKLAAEAVDLLLEGVEGIRGRVILVFGRESDGRLSSRIKDQSIEITEASPSRGRVKVNPRFLIPAYEGNRITVAGFRMSFPNLARMLRAGRHIVGAIYDIDVAPGEDVEFNVPRTRLIDQQMKVRLLLRKAMKDALLKAGVLERLTTEIGVRQRLRTRGA